MITIVLCADEGYVDKAAAVMASTICHSQTPEALHFYLLGYQLSTHTHQRLHNWFTTLPASLTVIEAESSSWPESALGRFGPAAMLRLGMHNWLPSSCQKVIYLDCDLVVLDDIANVSSFDMEGAPIASVANLQGTEQSRMGLGFQDYFNSGVLVVDLEGWKARNVLDQVDRILKQHDYALNYPDQDALNLIFQDWYRLPMRWNMQPYAYPAVEKKVAHYANWQKELEHAIREPAIVHFIGARKPWHANSRHPLTYLYQHYLSLTPWQPSVSVPPPPLQQRFKQMLAWFKTQRRRQQLQCKPVLQLPLHPKDSTT
ncbi:glycosyltransferase family 8 protein [Halomonas sp. ISL-60]|uniref:glycosyltransferase family 8 protein n=1 Tax=Halomonas sp. ISL-56 TaxID=2819149 RepID=UPI001BE790BA|nr:glycosyltransferase family 8 protein [Halomonas sp. ISL-56]MBT2771763.1 glycosyltransferase family 8 protein [Halomonas sp. ISL-60]MBT2803476.1 glycosyltransferase family 8 protein [Halomonas sp. ISL-56]